MYIKNRVFGLVLFFIVSFFVFINNSYASLTIEINQGVNKPYPIVILPFSNNKLNNKNIAAIKINNIIRSDLVKSGRFIISEVDNSLSLMDQSKSSFNSKQQFISKPDDIPWHKIDRLYPDNEYLVQGVVACKINKKSNKKSNKNSNQYCNIEYSLLNSQSHKVLIYKKFTNVDDSNLSKLAHFISDQIYHKITGVPGYFSSKIAYVLVSKHKNPNGYHKFLTYKLVIADSDGDNPHVLVKQKYNPIATPTFSADGKKLAYVSYVKNTMAVYIISLATGSSNLIANFPGINSAPAFSPDGKYLAVGLSKGSGSKVDLFLYNLKSKKFKQLTKVGTNTSPSFSPSGKELLFTSNRSGRAQIYNINLSNKKFNRKT